eukprot:TRINITY_DN18278_c4_g1_i1.p1 TRINITY_DN18278_c4_g1~~TRINITY_DN18278_c4_g1_i1.p1  ORF type:complete len:384 (+),score=64.21 TRINITY_DN18278_c4_g1_i1:47-1153(+)
MSGTVGFSGNLKGGQGEMKKTLSRDEAAAAWMCLIDEIEEIERGWSGIGVRPDRLAIALRGHDENVRETAPPDEPVQVYVNVQIPIHRAKGVGKYSECEVFFHLPRGYPAVPPVEQGEGDIEVNMTGHLSKPSMRVLAREVHLLVISKFEEAQVLGGYPKYMLEVLRWVERLDLTEFVASKCVPKRLEGLQRVWVRFHHIESKVKSAYGLLWGKDHGVRGVIGKGQPGFAVVEGPAAEVDLFIQKFTSVIHWGPVPAEILKTTYPTPEQRPLPPLALLSTTYPQTVTSSGAFNGRDSINFPLLATILSNQGHAEAAEELKSLLPAYYHENGHVDAEATSSAISAAKEVQNKAAPQPSKKKGKVKKRLQ